MSDCGTETTMSAIKNGPADLSAWNMAMTQLLDWYKTPSQMADEDIPAPTREIISMAYNLALKMRDKRFPGPLRVASDGEGGVVFERQSGSVFESIGIGATGRIEIVSFEGSHLTSRTLIEPSIDSDSTLYCDSNVQHSALLSHSTCLERVA